MPRPSKKKVIFTSEALQDLLQNIWSEADEQRTKAVFQFNKQNRDVKDNNDIALVSKINADYLKIVNDSIEKKLSVAKLIKDIVYKDSVNPNIDNSNQSDSSVTDDDKDAIYDLINKAAAKENIQLVLQQEKDSIKEIDESVNEEIDDPTEPF